MIAEKLHQKKPTSSRTNRTGGDGEAEGRSQENFRSWKESVVRDLEEQRRLEFKPEKGGHAEYAAASGFLAAGPQLEEP